MSQSFNSEKFIKVQREKDWEKACQTEKEEEVKEYNFTSSNEQQQETVREGRKQFSSSFLVLLIIVGVKSKTDKFFG